MSETPIIDDENTKTNEQVDDPSFADNIAIQDGLRESANSAQRLFEIESESNRVDETPDTAAGVDTDPTQTRLRITPRGRAVGAAVIATTTVGAVLGTPVAIDAVEKAQNEALLAKPTIQVTVQSGDGLQKIIEENVPQVASGQYDWRDVAGDINSLPQNGEISKPGYVLMPGDTISIPVYGSDNVESKNGQ